MKKIYVVSLESIKRCHTTAVFDNDQLIITHSMDLKGSPSVWKNKLLADLEEKNKAGFVCLVEDRTRSFSSHSTSFSFDNIEADGRTALQHCFDWYFSMEARGSIILDPSLERLRIKAGDEGGLVDIKQDDKGRIIYHANWSVLHGGHKAILMCVYAAVMENPLSDRWVNELLDRMQSTPLVNNSITSFASITKGVTRSNVARIEAVHCARQAEISKFLEGKNND